MNKCYCQIHGVKSVVTRCFWTSDTFARQHAHFLDTAQSTEGFRLSFVNKLLLKYIMDFIISVISVCVNELIGCDVTHVTRNT